MKVIFLDIDGVLNSGRYIKTGKFRKGDSFQEHNISMIDPKTVKYLNQITDATGAKIVLSSSWRIYRTPTKSACQKLFDDVGIHAPCIDITRHHPDEVRYVINRFSDKGWIDSVRRGHEIHAWLLEWESYPIDKFIILDDNSDMEYLLPRLVKTKWAEGLTKQDVKKAIELLND